MYEIGKVYIWQNCPGSKSRFNGLETTVTGKMGDFYVMCHDVIVQAQFTDTIGSDGLFVGAMLGELRPKNPPPGERLVRDLFEPKPVMEPA